MEKIKYSEDYEKILTYIKSISSEDFENIKEETVLFFLTKYEKLAASQYKYLKKILSRGTKIDGKLDYGEMNNFSILLPQEDFFLENLRSKYIPQALNNFNPDKVNNKESYCFASRMYFYFRHAVRDIASNWKKIMSTPQDNYKEMTFEEKVANEMEAKRIREMCYELRKNLDPLEVKILDLFIEGKKQKDMLLINEASGNPYSKGYISKLVKKIRIRMKSLLNTK